MGATRVRQNVPMVRKLTELSLYYITYVNMTVLMIKIQNWFSEITNGDVVFTQNYKYSYMFSGKTIITAPTDSLEGQSEVSIIGIANIIGMTRCGAILYLKHVKISHDSKVGNFSIVLDTFILNAINIRSIL